MLIVEVVVVVDGFEGKSEEGEGDCDCEEVAKEIIMDFDGPGSASPGGTNEDLGSSSNNNSVPPAWGPILELSKSGSISFSLNVASDFCFVDVKFLFSSVSPFEIKIPLIWSFSSKRAFPFSFPFPFPFINPFPFLDPLPFWSSCCYQHYHFHFHAEFVLRDVVHFQFPFPFDFHY